jgi:4-amino-4-deoxy-L-arabinose transferase-like glycosyltransferase
MGLMSANPVRFSALEFSMLAVAVLLGPCWFVGARRGIGAGFVAAIVVLASPVVIFTGATGYVDTWTMGFILAALLIGLDGAAGRAAPRPAFLLMGLFIGEAAAAKYTGLLFGGLTAVGVLVAVARWPWAIWRDLAAAVAGFCVTALPWYLWTIHTAGDPFYPFAVGIFGNGHHLWTPAELAFQQVDARASPQPGFASILHQDLHYLAGDIPYDTGANRSPLSWLLGLGVFGLLIRSARRDRLYLGALLGGVLCVAASLQLSADPRYTVPAVGPLAVAAGMTAGHVGAALRRWSPVLRWRALLLPAAMLAAAVIGLWSAAGYARSVYAGGRPPVSGSQVDSYVSARVPCFAAVEWLNAHAGGRYRAWGYVCEEARYYARGLLISDTFSAGSRLRIFDNGGSTLPPNATLWRRLAALHAGWAILPAGIPPNPKSLTGGGLFQLAATMGAENVYRVAPGPAGA